MLSRAYRSCLCGLLRTYAADNGRQYIQVLLFTRGLGVTWCHLVQVQTLMLELIVLTIASMAGMKCNAASFSACCQCIAV